MKENKFTDFGILIDLDGVIYNDTRLIPGAPDTIHWLRRRKIPFCFITNTTMRTREGLCKKLKSFGIDAEKEEIFSALYAAVLYVKQSGKKKCYLLLSEGAHEEFNGFELTEEDPDFVIVGDLGEDLTFEKLNTAFQKLYNGADLIALQKNRYWMSDRGITLDAGAFVVLLEFASGKEAIVVGKPDREFFHLALETLNVPKDRVIMIGDDLESDIAGAEQIGVRGILVKTGKYREQDVINSKIKPWRIIDSIADLPALIEKLN
jgi:HAD superfamily hydrolase (TIGR01458 family)